MIGCLFCRSYRDKTGKMYGLWEMMRPLVSTFILFFLMVFWAQQSSCQVMEQHPRLFYWTTGTAFSNIAVSGNHWIVDIFLKRCWKWQPPVYWHVGLRSRAFYDSVCRIQHFNSVHALHKNLKSISASKYIVPFELFKFTLDSLL